MSTSSAPTAISAAAPNEQENPRSIWFMTRQTAKDWSEDNAMRLAAAMACYVILALAPMLVITLKVLSWFMKGKETAVLESQVDQLVGPTGAQAIGETIRNANSGGGEATIISFAIVLVSASFVFVSLQDALNTIWEVKPKPKAGWWHWIRKRFLSIGMVFGIAILLMSSMAVTGLLHVIIDAVFGDGGGFAKVVGYAVDFVATIAIAWVLFMAVFRFLPDAKVTWSDVWLGALVTAVLFKLGQIAMAIYFAKAAPQSAYGAFGSLVAVLLWAYYSSMILFFGAEFTQVWAKVHGRAIEPEEHAEKITPAERTQEGLRGQKGVTSPSSRPMALPPGKPYGPPLPVPVGYVKAGERCAEEERKVYSVGAASAAVGAVAAGLATWYLASDRKTPTRKHAAAVRLNERLNAIETKLGRVSRMKEYLDRMEVKDRIDKVEHEIQRAGRHVRAKETGRPLWMVRLGDLIGGRWSNL